jgi:hypothetical protein
MISFRVVWSGSVATLAGLAIGGLALVSATSQELRADKQATLESSTGQSSVTALVTDHIQNGRVPTTANPPADVMTSQSLSGSINPLWAIPGTSLSAIEERPIFSPSRRPPVSVGPTPVQSQPAPIVNEPSRPSLTLIGAAAGKGDGIAIFLDETTKGIVRLKTGESHAGWILSLVKRREATLQKGRETVILDISNLSGQ